MPPIPLAQVLYLLGKISGIEPAESAGAVAAVKAEKPDPFRRDQQRYGAQIQFGNLAQASIAIEKCPPAFFAARVSQKIPSVHRQVHGAPAHPAAVEVEKCRP